MRPLAERAKGIAEKEGLDGKPIDAYLRPIQKHRQNLRAAIQEIESGAVLNGGAEWTHNPPSLWVGALSWLR
jgi:hypothetical protein